MNSANSNQITDKLLPEANRHFRNGNYSYARELYLKAIKNLPELENIIRPNIIWCEKKTSPNQIAQIKEILSEKITSNSETLTHQNYKKYLDSLRNDTLSLNTLIKITPIVKNSPFQRDILLFCWRILSNHNLTWLLTKHKNKPSNTIGTLILLTTDNRFWIKNRFLISNYFSFANNNHKYIDLVNTEPLDNKHKNILPNLVKKHTVKYRTENLSVIERKPNKSRVSFATIMLNEEKFIGLNIMQHYNLCDQWILVEGACRGYPERKVSEKGLSKDLTELIIRTFPDPCNKISYIQHGWTKSTGEDAKSELRNRYLENTTSEILVVLDADEFYRPEDIHAGICKIQEGYSAVVLPQVHFWKSTMKFITGGYYDVSHTRIFKNSPGMKYSTNHNFPEIDGKFIHERGQFKFQRVIKRTTDSDDFHFDGPTCFHMGFAKDVDDMRDKTEYYLNRGESDSRPVTTKSRAAWFDEDIPAECKIRSWNGNLPLSIDRN